MPSESEVSIGNDTNGKSSSFDSRHTSAISPLTRKNSITITARHESNAKLPKAKSSSYNPVSKKLQVSLMNCSNSVFALYRNHDRLRSFHICSVASLPRLYTYMYNN